MFDPSQALSGFRIPADVLVTLDYRPYHFALQPFHFLVRALHILTAAAFFGGIGVLDVRLMAARATLPLRALTDHILPWLYVTFTLALVSGLMLFFYDPVHVGSHAYFTLKLLFLVLGLVNAAMFHKLGLTAALQAETLPRGARLAGGLSLACWCLVMLCASLNVEGPPKVLLTSGPQAAVDLPLTQG